MSKNWMVIAAGGDGERMKNKISKIFLKLKGKPVIVHTLEAVEKSKEIASVLITVKAKNLSKLKKILEIYRFKKVKKIMVAARSRQESTWKALKWLKKQGIKTDDLLGVHNAVNALIEPLEIKKVFIAARKWGAALLAMQAKDTVKIADKNDFVVKTPLRKLVWHAQTPQVAKFGLFFKAFEKSAEENDWGTDDTMLMERLRVKIKIIPCSSKNIKITYPIDLVLAKEILKKG